MKTNGRPIETVRGSGNIFRDLNLPNPDLEQLRSILAARIIAVLDDRRLSVRQAREITGIAAADFSRIRRANLQRFTIDRLMAILHRLGQDVEVSVNVRPRVKVRATASAMQKSGPRTAHAEARP
jgi:predicted XRE-type DNA-binding protein